MLASHNSVTSACPFCHRDNSCQAQSSEPCWCFNQNMPAELLALVPDHLKNKRCICAQCLQRYNEDPEGFSVNYSL